MDVRLAICTAGEIFGGVERHILGMCAYAAGRGGPPPLLALFEDRELAAEARRQGLEPAIVRGRFRYDPRYGRRLAAVLAAGGVNLVHCHGYKATIAAALARRHHPCAIVKTEHGRVGPLAGRPHIWARAHLNRALDARVTRRAVAAVCYVTDDLRGAFDRAHAGLSRHTVHNGIDPLTRDGRPRPPELAEPGFHVAIVGRISAVKGLEHALRAMAAPNVPADLRLSILGTGPLRARLEEQIRDLGLAGRARILGFRRNVYDYLAHSDALLMPSLHEGLPYTILEAMSLGTPIVASGVAGLAEVLRDGETALLVRPGDAAGIAAALRRLRDDAGLRAGLARRAGEDFARRFTLQRMGEDYWRLYREVLAA